MSDLGELVPLGVVVRDTDGVPVNATSVRLHLTMPDGVTVMDGDAGSGVPPVLNPPPTTGYYAVDYTPQTMPGLYTWRWVATTPNLVLEGSFYVDPPGATAGLISLADAKRLLRIRADDTSHDDDVIAAVRTATEQAEAERGEALVRRPVSETRDLGPGQRAVSLTHRPVLSLTSVQRLAGDGSVLDTSVPPDVWVDGHGIVRSDRVWLGGVVRLNYLIGPATVPMAHRTAVGYILQAVWANRGGASGRPRVGGSQPEGGDDEDGSMPQRAQDLLGRGGRAPLVG